MQNKLFGVGHAHRLNTDQRLEAFMGSIPSSVDIYDHQVNNIANIFWMVQYHA